VAGNENQSYNKQSEEQNNLIIVGGEPNISIIINFD
jgi:hypothetical protein